jgi:hypothetical protein
MSQSLGNVQQCCMLIFSRPSSIKKIELEHKPGLHSLYYLSEEIVYLSIDHMSFAFFARLIDALELMRNGVKCFLVRKSGSWKGVTKRFSLLYNGKWLKNVEPTSSPSTASSSRQLCSSSSPRDKLCCLAREDVLRFLIGRLGALAPIPLTQISSLGAINPHYCHVEASVPAMEAIQKIPQDPCAVAVVKTTADGTRKILGDISTYKLWKCDYVSAAWALANLSAGRFVIGAGEKRTSIHISNAGTYHQPLLTHGRDRARGRRSSAAGASVSRRSR